MKESMLKGLLKSVLLNYPLVFKVTL